MNLFLFDTDHLSLYQRGDPSLVSKLNPATISRIAIPVITAEEAIRGRFAQIRAARTEVDLLEAYSWFRQTLELISDIKLVDYDGASHAIYKSLCQQKIRIGTQDLRIAAIALSTNAILVTRNRIHFGQIPSLTIEDWTV